MVYLKAFSQPKSLFWFKRFIKRCYIMSIEIVTYKNHLLNIRILHVKHPLDALCPVCSGPLLFGFSLPPSGKRFSEKKDAASAVSHILVVLIAYAGAVGRKALSGFCQQLHRLLVHAYDRALLIIRPAVHFKDILHSGNEGCTVIGRYAPALFQVRLILVFFRMRPTCV